MHAYVDCVSPLAHSEITYMFICHLRQSSGKMNPSVLSSIKLQYIERK